MYVKRTVYKYGKERETSIPVEDFVQEKVLGHDTRLEHQPSAVCEMVGRLLDILLRKKILNKDDLLDIVNTYMYNQETITLIEEETQS